MSTETAFAPIEVLSTPSDVVRGWIGQATKIGSRAADHLVTRMAEALDGDTSDVHALARGSFGHLEQLVDDDDLVARLAGAAGTSPVALSFRTRMVGVAMDPDEEPEEEAPPRYRFVMSDANPDRAFDIVEQGWDLDEFKMNPVAPWNHNYYQPAVGRWTNVAVSGGVLRGTLVPAPIEAYPMSVIVAEQLAAGVLRTVSVGFRPKAVVARASMDPEHPQYGERGMIFVQPRLLECSPTPMPMNPRAALSKALAGVPPEVEKEISRRIDAAEAGFPAEFWTVGGAAQAKPTFWSM